MANLTDAQRSAQAMINDTLGQFGLQSLGAWAWNEYLHGVPIEQIMLDMRNTDAYKQRFPGMAELAKKGQAITEADYIAKETADSELMRAYGLDPKFANRQELGNLIGSQVSTTELQQRLEDYKNVVQQAPPQVRDYLRNEFGVSTGDLIGYWLDPNQAAPLIHQKVQASQIGAQAKLTGFGDINAAQAMQLAGLGVDFNQAGSGFAKIAGLKSLAEAGPGVDGSQVGGVSQQDLIDAEFTGDAAAQARVVRAQQARTAQFQEGGAFTEDQKGVSGLGSAAI